MNPVSDVQPIASECQRVRAEGALSSITLLTDGEVPGQRVPTSSPMVASLLPQRTCAASQWVLESLLPDIRTLAMLLASQRASLDEAASPARFADAADWLAARIAVLGLSHVEVTLSGLAQLDEANRRLAALAQRSRVSLATAAPVLLTRTEAAPSDGRVLRGWAAQPLFDHQTVVNDISSLVQCSLAAHRRCAFRLQHLLAAVVPSHGVRPTLQD
ncbi:hypothetical protein [Paludibacterium denitrificans]|uniref:Uncharacterized protein n=1 Tax=Paludibacterium denitrificans TaxID=2675226 RepID=A0A844GD84_9NEIS|nr:hypothetical protein [Paludibacterium denitrificans]MTD32887.1 hypothetical protein [Paludibacterium denitrificans]